MLKARTSCGCWSIACAKCAKLWRRNDWSVSRSPEESYPTAAFDYQLPPDRIARYPAERRDESKLLVLERATGGIEHRVFRDVVSYFQPGDALVLNETRVFPARLLGKRPGGGEAEVLLLRPYAASPDRPYASEVLWEALVRPGSKLKPGKTLVIDDDFHVEIVDATPDGSRIVRLLSAASIEETLQRHGRIPLPPYMQREAEDIDRERYQTVYARHQGSVAAPTAGLHFTAALLAQLERQGVELVRIVL